MQDPVRHRHGSGWALALLLSLCVSGSGQRGVAAVDGVGIRILSPAEGAVLSPTEEVVVVCAVAGISREDSARFSVGVDFNGAEGGTFDISAPDEHTFALPPCSPGTHALLLSLFLDGELLAEHSSAFLCGDSELEAPGDGGAGSVRAAVDPPPSPAPRAPWRLSVESPTSCQVMDTASFSLRLRVEAPVDAPAREREGELIMEINGHPQKLPLESIDVSINDMPTGLHAVVLRAISTDAEILAEVPPQWFGVLAAFSLDNVEKVVGQGSTNARRAAEAFVCFSAYTHTLVPRLWISLANAGQHQRALTYLSQALNVQPNDPWFLLAYASCYYQQHRESCDAGSECYQREVVGRFVKVLENGIQSVDAMGGILEVVGITDPTAESDASLALKSALLRAEAHFNRVRRPAEVHTYPPGHPCRNDARPFKCVIIYTRQYLEELDDPWGPEKMLTGMGGANEAVIFMSRQLVKRGYHVAVYGNPSAADIAQRTDAFGVEWFPFWAYDEANAPGVFVVWWHHQDAVDIGRRAHSRFLWFHYRQYPQRYTPAFMETIDGAFAMSHYHAGQMPDYARPKTIVSANGIDPALFVDGVNAPLRFIYASHPFYGLETLLKVWPQIHAAVPGSTLEIYYGWTKGMLAFLERMGEKGARLKLSIDTMLLADGIINKGMVGQRELTEALAGCGFYLYTCEIAEISSISLMRAQAMGAVPITSRHLDSALNETAGRFDLGPPVRPGLIGRDPERLQEWVDRVIYVGNHPEEFESHRREMKAWSRATFSWERAADQWDLIFQHGLAGEGSMDIDKVAPAPPNAPGLGGSQQGEGGVEDGGHAEL